MRRTIVALGMLAACGAPRPRPVPPPPPLAVVAPEPAPKLAPVPAGAPRSWERWAAWGYLETSSLGFRAQLDDVWGGLAKLGRGQLSLLALDASPRGAFAVTRGALGTQVDEARPMRLVVGRDAGRNPVSAMLFAATRSTTPLPAHCASVERGDNRALVCGDDEPARALRDDYLARGLDRPPQGDLHAEQHEDLSMAPATVTVDASVDHATLHVTTRGTPRQPASSSVSPVALAAATRVQAVAPRVELRDGSVSGIDLRTPFTFDGFAIAVATPGGAYDASFTGESLAFIEMPIEKVAPHLVAHWRSFNGNGLITRVDPRPAPSGYPTGTRRFRVREWTTDSGEILQCAPADVHVMGGCRVVGHRPRTTSLTSDADTLIVPADGGTWIGSAGDAGRVSAILQILTSTTPAPAVWTLPATAAGKDSTPRAEIWWAQHALPNGDFAIEAEGHLRP